MTFCTSCFDSWQKHQCNTCSRYGCTRRVNFQNRLIVDECKEYVSANNPLALKPSKYCKNCGIPLQTHQKNNPKQTKLEV